MFLGRGAQSLHHPNLPIGKRVLPTAQGNKK
jgi:hypothetical protein